MLFGNKNPSASTAEVPRYQQVSVLSHKACKCRKLSRVEERDMESQCSCAHPSQIVLGGSKISFNSSRQRSIQKGISSPALALAVRPLAF